LRNGYFVRPAPAAPRSTKKEPAQWERAGQGSRTEGLLRDETEHNRRALHMQANGDAAKIAASFTRGEAAALTVIARQCQRAELRLARRRYRRARRLLEDRCQECHAASPRARAGAGQGKARSRSEVRDERRADRQQGLARMAEAGWGQKCDHHEYRFT
jgi:hypothetical protein